MKVLFVAAHPDDETLGAGGSILKHQKSGDEVHVLFLSGGATSRQIPQESAPGFEEQRKNAMAVLGVKQTTVMDLPDQKFDTLAFLDVAKIVSEYVEKHSPQIVYTHHYQDLNRDHRITSEAVMVACRPTPGHSVQEVYFWETLSSTEWAPRERAFRPQVFQDISKFLDQKIEALECYASEIRKYPHPRSTEGVRSLAKLRGVESGFEAAEAFEVLRVLRRN